MVWTPKYREYSREEICKAICKGGESAGWKLSAYEASDWRWCRIRFLREQDTHCYHLIEYVRDCTQVEKEVLNELLWSAQICMRFTKVEDEEPSWARASLD